MTQTKTKKRVNYRRSANTRKTLELLTTTQSVIEYMTGIIDTADLLGVNADDELFQFKKTLSELGWDYAKLNRLQTVACYKSLWGRNRMRPEVF